MQKVKVNGALTFDCPDGFHIMDAAELEKVYLDKNPERSGIWDKDRHLMVCVFYHKANALLSKFVSEKSVCANIGSQLSKRMPGYRGGGELEGELAGLRYSGFNYSYTAGETQQEASVRVIKHKSVTYTVYTYARSPMTEDDKAALDSVLGSFCFEERA